jgi:hypothetical protein
MQKSNIPAGIGVPIVMELARTRDTERMAVLFGELDTAYKNTPQYESGILATRLANDKAQVELDISELNRAQLHRTDRAEIKQLKQADLFDTSGIITSRTEEQAHNSWKTLGATKKVGIGGGANFRFTEKQKFLYAQNQTAELKAGSPLTIIQDGDFFVTDTQQLIQDLRTLDSIGLTESGQFALLPEEVSIAGTRKAQNAAAERLRKFHTVLQREDGDWAIEPLGGEDHDSFFILTKARTLANNINSKGRLTDQTIDDPWTFNEIPGGTDVRIRPPAQIQGPQEATFLQEQFGSATGDLQFPLFSGKVNPDAPPLAPKGGKFDRLFVAPTKAFIGGLNSAFEESLRRGGRPPGGQ